MRRRHKIAEGPSSAGAEQRWMNAVGSEPASASQAALVVGYDRRAESQEALRVAAGLAGRLHAQLYVLHAVDVTDYPIDPDASDWEHRMRGALDEERAAVTTALCDYTAGWTYQAVYGDPAESLIAAADHHDALMIVVGSRGEGWRAALERLMERSVSHRVIGRCQRPVLVVSHPC